MFQRGKQEFQRAENDNPESLRTISFLKRKQMFLVNFVTFEEDSSDFLANSEHRKLAGMVLSDNFPGGEVITSQIKTPTKN